MESENPWAELHPYVLDEIVRHVDSYGDYVRIRAACRSWSLHMPTDPAHMKNPWLVLSFEDEDATRFPFYNMEEGKIYHFDLPEIGKTIFRGSCYGWLIAVGIDDTLQIFNPFTREQIDLLPQSTFLDVKSYEPDRVGEEYTILHVDGEEYTDKTKIKKSHVLKIIISSPPNHDNNDFVAVAIYSEYERLAYYKVGNNRWIDMLTYEVGNNRWTDITTAELWCGYLDAIFHEGKLYAINWKAQLYMNMT